MSKKIVTFTIKELKEKTKIFLQRNNKNINVEITTGDIARYMLQPIEDGGLGLKKYRSTIYRKLRSGDNIITITIDDNSKADLPYKEKVSLVHEYLYENKFSEGDMITYEELEKIAEYSGFSTRQLGIQILKIDEAVINNLKQGTIKQVTIYPNGKYDDLELKDKIRIVKRIFERDYKEEKTFTIDKINEISNTFDIPIKELIIHIFNKDSQTYERLNREEISKIKYNGPITEYEEPIAKFTGVLGIKDLQESIFVEQEEIDDKFANCRNRVQVEELVFGVNDEIREKVEYLEFKYSEKYKSLIQQYKNDKIINGIEFESEKKYYYEYRKRYIEEILQIIKRNPQYNNKIQLNQLSIIAEDLGMTEEELSNEMIGKPMRYWRYHKYSLLQTKENIRLPQPFQEIMYNEIKQICDNISKRIARTNEMNEYDVQEMSDTLLLKLIEYGGNVVFNGNKKELDEIFYMLGGYARRIANYVIIDSNIKKKQLGIFKNGRDEEKIAEDHDFRLVDTKANTEQQAINNIEKSNESEKINRYAELANMDLEMLELLIDDEHIEYLEELSKKLKIEMIILKQRVEEEIEYLRGE